MSAPKQDKFLESGTYVIRGTFRNTLRIEEGLRMREDEAVDDALLDCGAELVDYEVRKIR